MARPKTGSGRRKPTTTELGLGWPHQQAADRLFRNLADGSPCPASLGTWTCGRPRWKDRTRNYDYRPDSTNPNSGKLQAHHSKISRQECIRRGLPIPLPDELIHGECNRMLGDGLINQNTEQPAAMPPTTGGIDTNTLAIAWPW